MSKNFTQSRKGAEKQEFGKPLCATAPLRVNFLGLVIVFGAACFGYMPVFAQEQPSRGSLSDVQAAMQAAQRRLAAGDAGSQTQEQQASVVEMLAVLIEAAKAREASSQGSGSSGKSPQPGPGEQSASQSQSKGPPGDTAGNGSQQADQSAAARIERGGPQSPWSKLRDKERDPVYSAIKERFPARYPQLLEQYYKSFQDGPKR